MTFWGVIAAIAVAAGGLAVLALVAAVVHAAWRDYRYGRRLDRQIEAAYKAEAVWRLTGQGVQYDGAWRRIGPTEPADLQAALVRLARADHDDLLIRDSRVGNVVPLRRRPYDHGGTAA